jgi:hypothetical protein
MIPVQAYAREKSSVKKISDTWKGVMETDHDDQ